LYTVAGYRRQYKELHKCAEFSGFLKGLLSDKFTEVGVFFKEKDSQKIIYGTLT
jgi:hypothetical protein